MAKNFHINDSGRIVECHASVGRCPKKNFASVEEAEDYVKNNHQMIETLSKNNKSSSRRLLKEAQRFYGADIVRSYHMSIPDDVVDVLDDLQNIGNPLIVGGAVRDSFSGSDNKDIDIEVHHTDIDSLVGFLRKNHYYVDEVGKQFGVLKVYKKNGVKDLDISVPRRENRTGAGHRSFDIQMDNDITVAEASERRDFTFNAIMYDHHRQVIVDPSGGFEDYQKKIMRHVSEKFAEDPLRVLRGFQFAGRFGLTYHPETAKLCQTLKNEYSVLSVERIQEEWGKFYTKSKEPMKAIQALQDSGWDDTIPGLKNSLQNPIVQQALQKIPNIPDKTKRIIYGSAIIGKYMNKEDQKMFLSHTIVGKTYQKMSKDLINVNHHDIATMKDRKYYAFVNNNRHFNFRNYRDFSKMINDDDSVVLAEKAITEGLGDGPESDFILGRDILSMTDKKPGPWLGKILNELREKQYSGTFTNKAEALSQAKNLLKKNDVM